MRLLAHAMIARPMQNVKIATAGCGYFSQFHHEAWQRLGVNHVAICDLDKVKTERFSRQYGGAKAFDSVEKMIDQTGPDLVDLILPPAHHLKHIQLAAEYGVNVVCQKPFTNNIDEAKLAVEVAAAAGIKLIVHENFRFQPWYRKIKQFIEADSFGQLYQVRFDLRPGDGQGRDAYLDRQPYFQQMPKFLIRETGIHFVDVFRFLCGEVVSVWSDLRRLNPVIKGEDAGIFVLEFGSGLRAVFDGNRLSDHAADNRRLTMGELMVEGEHATLRLNGFGQMFWRRHGDNEESEISYNWRDAGFGGDCVYHLQKHVIEHFKCGATLENCAVDYLKNLQVQQAIYAADAAGCKQYL